MGFLNFIMTDGNYFICKALLITYHYSLIALLWY